MQFNIAGKPIDVVKTFNYLGIILTEIGKFTMASNDLKTKGMRALFKINSILKSQKINDHIIKPKLFNLMVKPILLYGCQVWSQELIHIESKDMSKLDGIPWEHVHNKQCKYILGVKKHSRNIAARAELGRFTMYLNIIKLTLKFWLQILKHPNKLVSKAYREECYMDGKGETKSFI